MSSYIDVNLIKKEIKKLNIPKQYLNLNIDAIFTHEYSIFLSTRESAKTTESLIIGLTMYKLWRTQTIYVRCDNEQTTRSKIETLYGVVQKCRYVEAIFPNMYNDIEYSATKKCFYLIARDGEGAVIKRDDTPFCYVISNEHWLKYKSSMNIPKGDYFIFDEFLDSSRATLNQMVELWNNISTIGRVEDPTRRDNVHICMLANNVDEDSFWWDEFQIASNVKDMKHFGESFETTTELGTSIYFKTIDLNNERKERIKNKQIKFFGFTTRRAAQFTGTQIWSGLDYPHLPDRSWITEGDKVFDDFYIFHRDRYIRIDLYYNKDHQYFCFVHWSNKPKYDDKIIFTLNPTAENEFYGFGDYTEAKNLYDKMVKLLRLKKENRWYYENNRIGSIIKDYEKNID